MLTRRLSFAAVFLGVFGFPGVPIRAEAPPPARAATLRPRLIPMADRRNMLPVVNGRAGVHVVEGAFGTLAARDAAVVTCPDEPFLQNWTGTTSVACPCFIEGEEAGAVFSVPANHFPIEVLSVGIGWGSVFGGAPDSLEQAIHIYGAGLPNPGAPLFSFEGPLLSDGFINLFDLEPLPGEIIVPSGPFAVTLEFFNQNAGNQFAPSVVHDGNGCQAGKNVVFAIPGGWFDACALGVTGDWVFILVYRQANCDCNSNGIADATDITFGTSLDCNANDVPDECDIAEGTSIDCNSNGTPDECETIGGDDFDGDGDVDVADLGGFLDCLGGPDSAPTPASPACANLCLDAFDDDGDGDVDLGDFAVFLSNFTG